MRVTVRFDEVKHTAKRRVKCAGGCGRTLTRQTTFVKTVNPYNKNPDGTVKTYAEVYRSVRAEADAWQPTATCRACSDAQQLGSTR